LLPRTLPTESAALSDVWTEVRREAEALGVPERGVQLITRLRARLDAVASRAFQQPRQPRVACLVALDPPVVPGAWVTELVTWAGGELAPGAPNGGPRPTDHDELRGADPEIIVFAPAGLDLAGARAAAGRLAADPEWSALRAAREGRMYVADGTVGLDRPGPRVAELLEAMAEILHPAAFRFGLEGRTWARLDGNGAT
jgi:iron complex transport system substrate-binding protein